MHNRRELLHKVHYLWLLAGPVDAIVDVGVAVAGAAAPMPAAVAATALFDLATMSWTMTAYALAVPANFDRWLVGWVTWSLN